MTPDELRARLHDCWYFSKDGCRCLYCESKNPRHHEDCPITIALAAADAWEKESARDENAEVRGGPGVMPSIREVMEEVAGTKHGDAMGPEQEIGPGHTVRREKNGRFAAATMTTERAIEVAQVKKLSEGDKESGVCPRCGRRLSDAPPPGYFSLEDILRLVQALR